MADTPKDQGSPNGAQRDSENNVTPIVGPPPGAIKEPPPSPPEDHRAETKRRWTNDPPMFWVTFAGVIVVVAYTTVGAWQACLTKRQLEVMKGQLNTMEADRRPWIGGPSDIKSLISDDGKTVTFIQIFKNVGRTPTAGVYIDGKLIAEEDFWYSDVLAMCKTATDVVAKNMFTAIPGSDWILDIAEMPSSKGMIFKIDDLRKMKKPIIVGCVLYGSPLDNVLHKTGYLCWINIKGNSVSIPFVYAVDAD